MTSSSILIYSFMAIDKKECPEGIDVGGKEVSHVALLGHLAAVVPIKIMEFVHEIDAVLNQIKHLGHGEGAVFIFEGRRGREREKS